MLTIHIISLREAQQRRRHAASQMAARDLGFQFFDALNGVSGRDTFDAFDPEQFLLGTGRTPQAGEIGCYASHRELWKLCIVNNTPIVVMEDDFEIDEQFPRALEHVAELIQYFGLLRLQDEREGRKVPVMEVGDFCLQRYTQPPQCAMCYAINPVVAKRLYDRSRVFATPIDVFLRRTWGYGHPMYCLTPYTVKQSALIPESTIGHRPKSKKTLGVRIRRQSLRALWNLRLFHFNILQNDAERVRNYKQGTQHNNYRKPTRT